MNKPSHAPRQDAWAALRFQDFRLFFAGRVLLFMGFQMQTVAIAVVILTAALFPDIRKLGALYEQPSEDKSSGAKPTEALEAQQSNV